MRLLKGIAGVEAKPEFFTALGPVEIRVVGSVVYWRLEVVSTETSLDAEEPLEANEEAVKLNTSNITERQWPRPWLTSIVRVVVHVSKGAPGKEIFYS